MNKLRQLPPPAVLTVLALVAGLSLAASRTMQASEADEPAKKPALHLTLDDSSVPRDGKSLTSFSPVVKKVAPAVVTVTTTSLPKRQRGFTENIPPQLRRFFEQIPGMENARPQKQYGLGSGVIVTKDGYILTNNHVVDGADKIDVELSDGRRFTAKVVGTDPNSDVAVLKIKTNADDLPHATMADSDKLETGDIVLAIGNPFGIGQTVTMGMVSATGRTRLEGMPYEDFIQTDAAINPGNSGGALVDAEGRLVGINTLILANGGGGNQGIGFAIPSDLARRVMTGLVRDGRVVRGYMGVGIQDVSPLLAKEFKLENTSGALIGEVLPHGPGDKAGIKAGDIVVKLNGKKVSDSAHFRLAVSESAPGSAVTVELIRDGDSKSLDVVLGELKDPKAAVEHEDVSSNTDTLNGVTVADLDSSTRSQFQIPSDLHGVVVTEVAQDSPAYEAGLRQGDVVLDINRKPVRSADEAVKMTSHVKELRTLLRVWRLDPETGKGGTRFMAVDESKGN